MDKEKFLAVWRGAWNAYGRDVSGEMLSVAFNMLSRFTIEDVCRAVYQHMETSKFPPVPADVIAILTPRPESDGRPSAEIAWAMYPKSESETVIWTEEMAAAFGIASPIDDDRIAARMAFKEAYLAEVEKARAQRKPAKWSVSLGHDQRGREGPIADAVRLGRLSAAHASKLIPDMSEKFSQLEHDSKGQQRITSMAKEIS
jgi:hypothetical protein